MSLDVTKKDNTSTELRAEKKQKKKLKVIASLKPQRGHTLFKVDTKTCEITEAEFEKGDAPYKASEYVRKKSRKFKRPTVGVRRKVIIEEGFAYFSALNKKNVIKKMKLQADPKIIDELLAKLDN